MARSGTRGSAILGIAGRYPLREYLRQSPRKPWTNSFSYPGELAIVLIFFFFLLSLCMFIVVFFLSFFEIRSFYAPALAGLKLIM